MTEPTSGTMKPAPADLLTARIGSVKPDGAPRSFGSAEKLYCVLAQQMAAFVSALGQQG